MVDSKLDSKRIAKNTLILYIRMFFVMAIAIYTSRVVLATLGVEDYGIFNAVGGIVGMFALVSGSMSNSVMRFVTFELGKGEKGNLTKVFSTSVNVMLVLALIVIILGETVGVWFLNDKMSIPVGRMTAANWVFQFSLLSFAITVLSIPYNATIIAYERMNVFAFISILEVVLKLLIVYVLQMTGFDRLVLYAFLLLIVAIIIRLIYWCYCRKYFDECRYRLIFDKSLLHQMFGFAGWNFFGQGMAVINQQGTNVVMNLFFGVLINAARGVSTQVQSVVVQFVNSFTVALNPQITKSYASGDIASMHSLVFNGAKISYYLTLLISVPLFIEAETVLNIWLDIVPDHAVSFVRLTLISLLVSIIPITLIPAVHATGRIRSFMIASGMTQLLFFLLTIVAYHLGADAESAYWLLILDYCVLLFVQLFYSSKLIQLSIREYLIKVLLPIVYVTIPSTIIPWIIINYLEPTVWRLLFSLVLCTICTLSFSYFIGLTKQEQNMVKDEAVNKLNLFRK